MVCFLAGFHWIFCFWQIFIESCSLDGFSLDVVLFGGLLQTITNFADILIVSYMIFKEREGQPKRHKRRCSLFSFSHKMSQDEEEEFSVTS